MLTAILVLVVAAFIAAVVAAAGKCPLWVSVMLLCVVHLLQTLPVGR
jgi:hypothetical protein